MTKRPYPRYQRRHDAILLAILENPLQTNKESPRPPAIARRRYLASSAHLISSISTMLLSSRSPTELEPSG